MANVIDHEQIEEFMPHEEDTTKDLYLTFEIDNEDYAIEVANINEIIVMCAITIVPDTPNYVKGIINLRGDIVPVIDVRLRFGKPEIEVTELSCIVVINYEEYVLGLIVDAVKGVMTIPEDHISAPPNAKLSYSNLFVRNIGRVEQDVKLLINLERLIFE